MANHIMCIKSYVDYNHGLVFSKNNVYNILEEYNNDKIFVTSNLYQTRITLDTSAEYFNEHFKIM